MAHPASSWLRIASWVALIAALAPIAYSLIVVSRMLWDVHVAGPAYHDTYYVVAAGPKTIAFVAVVCILIALTFVLRRIASHLDRNSRGER